MTEEGGRPDPLNEQARPPRRWLPQTFVLVAVITGGVVLGAKIWQPVRRVEQKVAQGVTGPIRDAVRRGSPLEALPDLIDDACPAVFALHYDGAPDPAPQAILLTQEGYAVTTVSIDAKAVVTAWLNDGRRLAVHAGGRDAIAGVTLLKLDAKDLPTVPLGEIDLPRLGTWGFTLASPTGTGCAVESGLVASDSTTEAATADYYLRVHAGTAIPVPGTPFFTADGRLAGLARPPAGKDSAQDHYLPIDLLTTAVSGLMRAAPANPFGMIVEDLAPNLADRLGADRGRGAAIVMLDPAGVAAKAGLQVGDVILSAGQSPISSSSEFGRMAAPDRPLDLVITRGLDQSTRTITVPAPRPAG